MRSPHLFPQVNNFGVSTSPFHVRCSHDMLLDAMQPGHVIDTFHGKGAPMAEPPNQSTHQGTFDAHSPPITFGARRVYHQYSVVIPQIHLVLVSLLQGVAFGVLLLQPIPLPETLGKTTLSFFLAHYFYAPYLISSLIILIAWMDFVYAAVVLIWPPTALQAGLTYSLAVAEVTMVRNVESLPIWVSAAGAVTIIGGITRINNYRIYTHHDFEDTKLGARMLRNEVIYGTVYLVLGSIGMAYGFAYDWLLSQVRSVVPQGNADQLLHWVSYIDLVVDVVVILIVDVLYRQQLLRQITKDTSLEVTRHGGIRHKN